MAWHAVAAPLLIALLASCGADSDDSFQSTAVQVFMREEARDRTDDPAAFTTRDSLPECTVVVQHGEIPSMDCLRDYYERGQPAEAAYESYRSGADSKLDWWRVDADGRVDYWSRVVDLGFYSRGEVEPGGSWLHAECDGLSFDEHGQPVAWLPDEVGATADSEDGHACTLLERIPIELEIPADVLAAVEEAYWCQVDSSRPQDCVIPR